MIFIQADMLAHCIFYIASATYEQHFEKILASDHLFKNVAKYKFNDEDWLFSIKPKL